jgi:acyl carrier protein
MIANQQTAAVTATDGGELEIPAVAKLRDWIASKSQRPAAVGMDTRLIDDGVLDSLQMVNFLLYIEEIRGKEIPEMLIQPEYFVSLRMIHDTFFRPT